MTPYSPVAASSSATRPSDDRIVVPRRTGNIGSDVYSSSVVTPVSGRSGLIEANTCRSAGTRSPGRPLERTCTVIDAGVCCAYDRYTCGGDDSSSRSNRYLPLAATPITVAGPGARVDRQADRLATGQESLNERLIHDDDRCAAGRIALVNRAAGLELDPHRLEIAAGDPVGQNRHALVLRGDVAGHLDVDRSVAAEAQRNERRGRGRRDAGQRADSREQAIDGHHSLLGRPVARLIEIGRDEQHGFRPG